jgi:hypothetical protein
MVATPNPSFVTGAVTATVGGVPVPTENIKPAPGLAGVVTLIAGTAAVTLAAPGSGGFVLPVGVPVQLMLGGVKLLATSGGTGVVSYAYATGG